MLQLLIDNQKSRMVGDLRAIDKLREITKIRKPGAFFSSAYGKGGWDGCVRYITETGLFSTGFLPLMVKHIKELEIEYEIIDRRKSFKPTEPFIEMENGDTLRDYQLDVVTKTLENRFEGIRFIRGVVDAATNAGKSYIAAGIFGSFNSKRRGLLLIDNTEIFAQLYDDLKTYLGADNVGCIASKKVDIKRINVAMVQTLGIRLRKDRKLANLITETDIVLVDECDTTAVKSYGKKILALACNASVRIGLSGTPFSHKDKTKNAEVLSYFGPSLIRITNKELVEKGVSTLPVIRITQGNQKELEDEDYADEYRKGITINKQRNRFVWTRVMKHIKKERLPILIMVRYREHIDALLKTCPKEIKDAYKIDWVHGAKGKSRKVVLDKFKNGKLDILIASMIIQRGKNLPLTKVLINAAGGTSERVLLQIFGRLLRAHATKSKVYMEDFMDKGLRLGKHSRRRVIYYKNQGFGIKELYKKQTI